MKKPKGLQKALGKQQQQQARRKRQEAHEKRQEELLKQQNKPKPKSGSAPSSSKSKGKGKAEAETTDGPSTADGVAVKRAPKYSPYHDGQTVLFVGEGDFSFAVSWASKYPRSAKQSVATSYDSREVGSSKYPDLAGNVERLTTSGMTVLFGVDAQHLDRDKQLKALKRTYDRIVFNYPHVGLGEKDEARNVRLNQILLLRFLRSVAPLLRKSATLDAGYVYGTHLGRKRKRRPDDDEEEEELPSDPESASDGEDQDASDGKGAQSPASVLVTLFACKPYNLWALPSLAKSGRQLGPAILPFPESRDAATCQPVYRVERSFAFDRADWPGYEHRRTIGQRGGNQSESLLDRQHAGARTWELVPVADREGNDDD